MSTATPVGEISEVTRMLHIPEVLLEILPADIPYSFLELEIADAQLTGVDDSESGRQVLSHEFLECLDRHQIERYTPRTMWSDWRSLQQQITHAMETGNTGIVPNNVTGYEGNVESNTKAPRQGFPTNESIYHYTQSGNYIRLPRRATHPLYRDYRFLRRYRNEGLPFFLYKYTYVIPGEIIDEGNLAENNNGELYETGPTYAPDDLFDFYILFVFTGYFTLKCYIVWDVDPHFSDIIETSLNHIRSALSMCAPATALPYINNIPRAARELEATGAMRSLARVPVNAGPGHLPLNIIRQIQEYRGTPEHLPPRQRRSTRRRKANRKLSRKSRKA